MRPLKIYLASSWRNKHYETVLQVLRFQGYETYDFKHPEDQSLSGFSWENLHKDVKSWTCEDFKQNLHHPEATNAFEKDFRAMHEADYCVLLLPCGRSAHSEAGWMKGQGKKVFILDLSEHPTPELMYQMYDMYDTRLIDLVEHIEDSYNEDNMLLKEEIQHMVNLEASVVKDVEEFVKTYKAPTVGVKELSIRECLDILYEVEDYFWGDRSGFDKIMHAQMVFAKELRKRLFNLSLD